MQKLTSILICLLLLSCRGPNEPILPWDDEFDPGYGAEYFFDDQLSLGIEAQLNFSKSADNSGRFGNPGGLNANTATMLFATIYF